VPHHVMGETELLPDFPPLLIEVRDDKRKSFQGILRWCPGGDSNLSGPTT
jgi:hypothetical protein